MSQLKRQLNTRGQTLINRIELGLGSLFVLVAIIYASVRGQKFGTQLPATYRTTSAPNAIPVDFINQFFPSNIPSPSYEFPSVTLCPQVGSLTGTISCYVTKSPSGIKVPCDDKGTYSRTVIRSGNPLECQTMNDLPGKALLATDAGDELTITATVTGTKPGSPSGVFVTAHPAIGPDATIPRTFDNYFVASTGTLTEVMAK